MPHCFSDPESPPPSSVTCAAVRWRYPYLLFLALWLCLSVAHAQVPLNLGIALDGQSGLSVDVRLLSPLESTDTLSLDVELLTQDSLLDASLSAGDTLPGLEGGEAIGIGGEGLQALSGLGADASPASGRPRLSCEGPGCQAQGRGEELALLEAACEGEGCEAESVCERENESCTLEIVTGQPVVLRGVTFEFDSARLKPESRDILDRALIRLRRNSDTRFAVYGHTDARGNPAYNRQLSRQRAKAVHDYFVDAGIDSDRLVYRGYGDTRPIAPNTRDDGRDNPGGRAANRRVELEAVDTETFVRLERENQEQQIRARLERLRVQALAQARQQQAEQRPEEQQREPVEQQQTAPAYEEGMDDAPDVPAAREERSAERGEREETGDYRLEVVPLQVD